MKFNKIAAFILAAACAVGCVSCEKEKSENKAGNTEIIENIGENEVGEIITPDENSEEYELGTYRFSSNGIKLYYEEEAVSTELMLALESYFLTLQNNDFEGYKNSLYPDYAQRYGDYLKEQYSGTMEGSDEYTLENSFDMQCANLKNMLVDELTYASETEQEFSGEYKITRIRAERPTLAEGETEESRIDSFFEYYKEILDVDYKSIVEKDSEGLECITFFVIVEAEDGEEHKIINDMNIIFVKKDGKYYTFG